jgi:dTDP-4-amino-4,6-dideoxygalactose transaminase
LKTIPFFSLEKQHRQIRNDLQQKLMSVIDAGWFVSGKELTAFENEFALYCDTSHAIGVGNGLDALTFCLLAAQVGKGDEVIVPAHTYIATWLAITRVGAIPIPIEPEPMSFNIDVDKIEDKITSKTKVILPVHLYGQACNMSSILQLAEKHQMKIIEDNAQAQGSKWKGKATGSWGTVNATSFYPTKNIGALGDGGAVTTNDKTLAEQCRQWGNYGFEKKNVAERLGYNSRLDELQAGLLRVKLPIVSSWIEEKRKIASTYVDQLKGVGDLILPAAESNAFHTYHLFVVRSSYRDNLKTFLQQHAIETQIHYPIPPHLQKPYQYLNFKKGDFPITEQMAETALSLPIWPGMEPDDLAYITDTIRTFFR